MKILLATGIYPPEVGGPATYTKGLADALRARGYLVQVVTYGERPSNDRDDVTWVSRRGGSLIRYLRYAWRVYRCSRSADIIYAQGGVSEGFPSAVVAWLTGRRMIVRIPGDFAWEMARQGTERSLLEEFLQTRHSGKIGWFEKMERWTVRHARRVIVPSGYLKTVVHRWGVESNRIEVIQSVAEPLPAVRDRQVLRAEKGVDGNVVCLTAVRAVPWKGVAELIEWWSDLPPTHLLVVAGDGPELHAWKESANALNLSDRVRFLGGLTRAQLAEWYAMADVFLLHSGYEGYPHVVAEAASAGVPSLVSNQGGNPETVEDFPEHVTVLSYQDSASWVRALRDVSIRSESQGSVNVQQGQTQMVDRIESILREETDELLCQNMNVVMVGYERDFVDSGSSAFKRLALLAREGVSVTSLVLSSGFQKDTHVNDGAVQAFSFSGSSFTRIWRAWKAGIREVRLHRWKTIVSAQDPFVAGWVGYAVSRWTNVPLEVQEHGDFFSGEWKKERWYHRVSGFCAIILLRRAERVRVVSDRVRDHLIAKGIDQKRIHVAPVAQDVADLLEIPLRERRSGDVFRFVMPCRFVRQKGLDVALRAFQIVNKKKSGAFRVSITGSGPLLSDISAEVDAHGLSRCVDIQDWQSSDRLWRDADGIVVGSRYEGWGRTIVEAMAAGVSVVATDVGCVGSFFRPDVDGLVVPIGDAEALSDRMTKMMDDAESRERMRVSARARIADLPSGDDLRSRQRIVWREMVAEIRSVGPRFDLWVVGFVLFAILTRTASVALFHHSLVNREWGFYTLVDHFLHGYGYSYSLEPGCASAYRSPGYLFFLTALYTFFSPENTLAQAIIQNLFVVGGLWLVYVVGKRLVGKRAALIAGLLMACYPYTFYHYTQYYHTFLSSFFLLLLVWFLLRLEETKRWRHAFGAGLSIGCLAYVQGTILPATPFIAAWLAWSWWPDWKRTLKAVCILAVCSAGLIAPWTYRNWKVFGHFVPLTTDLGHALFKANNETIYALTLHGYPQEIVSEETVSSTNPAYKQYRMPAEVEAELRQSGQYRSSIAWTEWHPKEPGLYRTCPRGADELSEYDFNQYWLVRANGWIVDHWWTEGWKLSLLKLRTFWQPSLFPSVKTGAPWSFAGNPLKEWLARISVTAASTLVIFGGWIGILVFAIRKRDKRVWLVVSILVVYSLLHMLVAGYTKYRIPLDNLLAVYAGWVIVRTYDFVLGRRKV